MREVALSKFGLLTVEQVAALRGVAARTVQRWIENGGVSVVVVGGGRNRKYLVPKDDAESYQPAAVGAPEGNQNAAKKKRGRPRKVKAEK